MTPGDGEAFADLVAFRDSPAINEAHRLALASTSVNQRGAATGVNRMAYAYATGADGSAGNDEGE
jgi:hypothetical protein